MRILVLVKQVPETSAVRMDEKTGTLVRNGAEAIVNPLDLYSIETALRLKAQFGATVCALSMGPGAAESALREAIAMGVDEGVLVSDRAFAGSDTWATANILSAAAKTLPPFDLLICGERATDGDTGQVGPEMASALGLPIATYVRAVTQVTDTAITVERATEHGVETVELTLPAAMAVQKAIGEPRLPTLDGKIRARDAVIRTLTLADLQLPADRIGLAGSPTRVVKIFHPKIQRHCDLQSANGGEAAVKTAVGSLIQFMSDKDIIGRAGK